MLYQAKRLDGVHPDLAEVVREVAVNDDVIVIQGERSLADEQAAIDSGHSSLRDPRNSKHVVIPGVRPFAMAVDLVRFPIVWGDIDGFRSLNDRMQAVAKLRGVALGWAGWWMKVRVKEFDHWELLG